MEYVMAQGNFGSKSGYNSHSMDVLFRSAGLRNLFVNLQRQGRYNWKALRKYPWLSPFAWIYQGLRYMRLGFGHGISFKDLKKEKGAQNEMAALFRRMGLKTGGRNTRYYISSSPLRLSRTDASSISGESWIIA